MTKYYFNHKSKVAQIAKKEVKKTTSKSKPNLVKKLDRIFSLYIRLRDVMPNGYVRCISCGQIKSFEDVDCGHFHSRRHMATRFSEDNCHAECRYCLTPDALILMEDLSWKPLGEISEGDCLFAFDEDNEGRHKHRQYRTGVVTHLHRDIQNVYRVRLENGDHVDTTADHKWLVRDRGSRMKWMKTKDLWCNGKRLNGNNKTGPHWGEISTTVCKIIKVVYHDESNDSGWLAGMIDADGHLCQQNIFEKDGSVRYGFRIGVAQSEHYPKICSRLRDLITKFTDNGKYCTQRMDGRQGNMKSNYRTYQYLVTGSNIEKVQFLQRVRPIKSDKFDVNKLGSVKSQYDTKVKSVEYLGKREIVVMETSTHTFIANGYGMHNCNRFSADHLIGYQRKLIQKIGQQRFDLLNVKAHSTCNFTDSELNDMISHYTAEVKKLSSLKGIKVNI